MNPRKSLIHDPQIRPKLPGPEILVQASPPASLAGGGGPAPPPSRTAPVHGGEGLLGGGPPVTPLPPWEVAPWPHLRRAGRRTPPGTSRNRPACTRRRPCRRRPASRPRPC